MDRFWKYKLDHVVFWVATVGFYMFTKLDLIRNAGLEHYVIDTIVRNGLLAVLLYFNLLFLIPRFAQRKKIFSYTILLVAALTGYVLLKNAYDVYLYGYVTGIESQKSFFYNTYYNFSIAFFYLAFSIALYLSKAWYTQRELIRKMEMEKLNAELDYLRAQINPHFVFNSINTIYFQIDRKNETARRSLSSFSEMLRYQLYECNGKEIPVEKEVAYLKNYVALQQMRKDEHYNITFMEGEGLRGFAISPLLLIPFIENAFKHISHYPERNEIRIRLARDENIFMLSVYNTKEENGKSKAYTGIGLKNARRRLELLYKDRHVLAIDDKPGSFEVNLKLYINEKK